MQVQIVIKAPGEKISKQVVEIESDQDITNALWESRTFLREQLHTGKQQDNKLLIK